jgi:hypothetical protein
MTTFFHAWRRRQAIRQAEEWDEEREAARSAVEEVPPWIRSDVQRIIETLIEGPDSAVDSALTELDRLLAIDPALHNSFFRLRVVEDALEFLRSGES